MSIDDKLLDPRELPYIPLEILEKIALYIPDIATSRNLALTCRSLRDAGEIGCWSVVDLTSGGWDPLAMESTPPRRPLSLKAYQKRADIVDSKLKHALAALSSYPFRQERITAIRIEPSDGVEGRRAQALIDLLKLLARGLQNLAITPLPFEHNTGIEGHYYWLGDNLFLSLLGRVHFPKVTHCQLAIKPQRRAAGGYLEEIVTRLPKLRTLEICSTASSFADSHPFPPYKHQHTIPLESLTFNHMADDPSSSSYLQAILETTPNLSFLRVTGGWAPPAYGAPADDVLLTMAGLDNLKTVVMVHGGGLAGTEKPSLDHSHFGEEVRLRVEQVAIEDPSFEEVMELDMHFHASHNTPLRYLTILTGPCLSPAGYVSLGIGPLPDCAYKAGSDAIKRLRLVPSLTTILFLRLPQPCPSPYAHGFVEPEYFVPPDRWEDEGHRGMVIREYVNPGSAETFFHIRVLSRVDYDDLEKSPFLGARRSWKDFVSYNGLYVHLGVVEEVYEAMGEVPEFVHGGRNLALPEKAWDMLRDYAAKVKVARQAYELAEAEEAEEDEGALPDELIPGDDEAVAENDEDGEDGIDDVDEDDGDDDGDDDQEEEVNWDEIDDEPLYSGRIRVWWPV